jgi:hypothetical protein
MKKNALEPGEEFDPTTGQVAYNASYFTRMMRGFLRGGPLQVAINVWHIIYFLASLSMCGLGMYAAVDGKMTPFFLC